MLLSNRSKIVTKWMRCTQKWRLKSRVSTRIFWQTTPLYKEVWHYKLHLSHETNQVSSISNQHFIEAWNIINSEMTKLTQKPEVARVLREEDQKAKIEIVGLFFSRTQFCTLHINKYAHRNENKTLSCTSWKKNENN